MFRAVHFSFLSFFFLTFPFFRFCQGGADFVRVAYVLSGRRRFCQSGVDFESEAVRLDRIEELRARPPDHENVQGNVPAYARQANAATEVRAIIPLLLIPHCYAKCIRI